MECNPDGVVPPPERQAPVKCATEDAIQQSPALSSEEFLQFKRKATTIVEEYFSTDDVAATANELRELRVPCYHYYFVKKLVSVAMDRHDREKEMAAVLLSSLYGDVIDRPQLYKGFCKLTESCDDLFVDTPDAVDILAVFVARAIVDDMLPPAFLAKQRACLPEGRKGAEVLHRAEKSYLSVPHHGEIVLQRWGGSKRITVEEAKAKISDILEEYLAAGDRNEACRCIRDLKIPFFHHDVVKRALVLAMERGGAAEDHILDLLKSASEEGVINESQITKGFDRLIDSVDDLALDVPNARRLLKSVILKASSEGWLCASCLKPLPPEPKKTSEVDNTAVRQFKATVENFIKEYFLTGDIIEVVSSLEAENYSCCSSFNAIFVKKLINAAMDRKKREKEMASVLLSSLRMPPGDVVAGFHLLIESAEDAALDNPAIVEDLTMFFARSVVDEVIAPSDLESMEEDASRGTADGSTGMLALRNARALLGAKLSAERILRGWGGGGSGKAGWELDEVKDKIGKLLQEYDCGGDIREACRCIKDLGMPFFHHEVVKKALVAIIEKRGKDQRLWGLLSECYGRGLITPNQMAKGFERVADCVEDLALDVPDAGRQLGCCVERAKKGGWLDASFSIARPVQPVSNGVCT
ncbi:MA3 DOMAIN-CONTAINING TRANSLATION REGULATORY FACTOR 2-like [Phragmites australis]|uniref:MA3 DOMAIN-CONTAINING TRANSLATION REGULATORY FACTOR 2-like n=1 Tax=Phragmites australis TaxID=29695 RepID=UPI002D77DE0E|nr:MA3 DOMAIN-CONTAINING TRANSLATION REGULATORY FACTOR 2-like [Phragmites australis]